MNRYDRYLIVYTLYFLSFSSSFFLHLVFCFYIFILFCSNVSIRSLYFLYFIFCNSKQLRKLNKVYSFVHSFSLSLLFYIKCYLDEAIFVPLLIFVA